MSKEIEDLKEESEGLKFELITQYLENNKINQEKIIELLSDIKDLLSK